MVESGAALANELVRIAAVQVSLGTTSYGWGNEYGGHIVLIPACQASLRIVDNQEFF